MNTFKQIYKQVQKMIRPPVFADIEINDFINRGIDEFHRFCPDKDCRKKFKNWHGVKMHMAKIHGWHGRDTGEV